MLKKQHFYLKISKIFLTKYQIQHKIPNQNL